MALGPDIESQVTEQEEGTVESASGLQLPARDRRTEIDDFLNSQIFRGDKGDSFSASPGAMTSDLRFPSRSRGIRAGGSPSRFAGGNIPIFVGEGARFPQAIIDERMKAIEDAAFKQELQRSQDTANVFAPPEDIYALQENGYYDDWLDGVEGILGDWTKRLGSEQKALRAVSGGSAAATADMQRHNMKTRLIARETNTLAERSAEILEAHADDDKSVLPQAVETAGKFLSGKIGRLDDPDSVKQIADANVTYSLNSSLSTMIKNIDKQVTTKITNRLSKIQEQNPDISDNKLYEMLLTETEKFIGEGEAGMLAENYVEMNLSAAKQVFGDRDSAVESIKQTILDSKQREVEKTMKTIKNFAPDRDRKERFGFGKGYGWTGKASVMREQDRSVNMYNPSVDQVGTVEVPDSYHVADRSKTENAGINLSPQIVRNETTGEEVEIAGQIRARINDIQLRPVRIDNDGNVDYDWYVVGIVEDYPQMKVTDKVGDLEKEELVYDDMPFSARYDPLKGKIAAEYNFNLDERSIQDITPEERNSGIFKFKQKEGGSSVTGSTSIQVGQIVKGYRFKGGDPNDKNNWEEAE